MKQKESVAAPGHQGLRVAEMIQSGKGQESAIERAPGIYECRGIGNSYLVTTPEGDVLVNAGTLGDARRGRELFARVSHNPIRYIILTQGHANQFGGLEVYKTSDTRVIAQRSYPQDRHYNEALKEHYVRGSRRIFGGFTGSPKDIVPTKEVMPDTYFDDRHLVEMGGRRFEIIATPGGESRSALIVWLPHERIAIVGNLFGPLFGNHPNLNTLRGDKPRWATQFIDSIKKVRELGPELLLTGHEAIRGTDYIRSEITRIADAVQWVHDKTIEGMNAGKDIRTLMREIKTPPELTLTEEYGKLAWNVRAIWHEYTGWFDPARGTTDLYGLPPSSVAPALVELAGGVDKLVQRASQFVEDGLPLEALHMLEIALAVEPSSGSGRDVKREALQTLLQQVGDRNLWERMWISAEIHGLEPETQS